MDGNSTALFEKAINIEKFVEVQVSAKGKDRQYRGTSFLFTDGSRQEKILQDLPPLVQAVQLTVGLYVDLQDIRCQLLDNSGKPIKLTSSGTTNRRHGPLDWTDITFGAEGKRWVLPDGAKPHKVVCDPAFRSHSKLVTGTPFEMSTLNITISR